MNAKKKNTEIDIKKIPQEVRDVMDALAKAGFEGYIVGGCVRDMMRGVDPKDWDVATNALPEDIQRVFPKHFYENAFGTVTVLTDSVDASLKEIQITTYRVEADYTDSRHPGSVEWVKDITEDLSRRDFTFNAIALGVEGNEVIVKDPFEGIADLEQGLVRAVRDPKKRFTEDALRVMRAVRFASALSFSIEKETEEAIKKSAPLLKEISKERIRDELLRMAESPNAAQGIEMMRKLGLLQYTIPEIEEGYGVGQNKHHIYDCYEHSLKALEYAARQDFSVQVRLASLFHDIGKPRVKAGDGPDSTFYNHEVVGANMTYQILKRLHFPKKDMEKITKLVRYHLFYYNVGEVTESAVRRLLRKVGKEDIEDLLQLRMADRIGSGVPKAEPYKLRHLRYLIEKVSQDPIIPSMLSVSGKEVMEKASVAPGPKVGYILDILLGYVLEDPEKNTKAFLLKEVEKLKGLSDEELASQATEARKKREEVEMKRDEMTKKKYWVT